MRFKSVLLILFGSFVQGAAAQAIQTAQGVRAQEVVAVGPGGYVTASYENRPLADVLEDIARRGGARVSYNNKLIPANTRVSVDLTRAPLAQAFDRALEGTNLRAQQVSSKEWTVSRAPRAVKGMATGVVAGRITDSKTGKGISGATVSVGTDTRGISSGEDGGYRITGVPSGGHTVTVRLVGYAKQTRQVTVGEGATVTVDFKMEPSASVLDQVVVTGTVAQTELRAVPNAITVVTAKQIEERGITHIDQLFRGEIPGLFSLEQGAGATFGQVVMFSRGATRISGSAFTAVEYTNTIKTYVDGVEMANPSYLSQIDPKSIERIEILTGPQASTIYGANAINGVMQIFTKRGSAARPSMMLSLSEGLAQNNFSSALSSSHQYDGSASGTEGKISYNVGSSWSYTGAWSPGQQMQRTSLYGGANSRFTMFSLDLSARQGWTRNKQEGRAEQAITDLRQSGVFELAPSAILTTPSVSSLTGRTLGITVGFTPLSWWSHQVTLGSDASDTQIIGSIPGFVVVFDTSYSNYQTPSSRVSQSYSSTVRMQFGSLAQATLTYGGDHWRSRSSSVNWSIQPLAGNAITNTSITRNKDKNSGAYIQGQFGLWDALFLTYGIRADWNPNYGELARVRPGRYGVSYSKNFGVVSAKLRGSYGRSIRPPESGNKLGFLNPTTSANAALLAFYGSNLYRTLPNPELGPEFQQGGEGGMELYLGSRASFVVTRFNQTVDGLISNVSGVDSVRALEPGRSAVAIVNCNPTSTSPSFSPRSDGYCYYVQSQFLNVASVRNQGWEMQGSLNTGPFTTSGTYSWTKSRVIGVTPRYRAFFAGSPSFVPGQTSNFVPEHTWAVNVSYISPKTSLGINVNGLGQIVRRGDLGDLVIPTSNNLRLRVTEAYSFADLFSYRRPMSGYTTANLNASRRLSSKLEATLQITNLTDHYQNDSHYQYPVLGRQTLLGARLRFQ